MTIVTPIPRDEPLQWTTCGGDVVPVGSRGQLGELIENWNAYGRSAHVGSQTAPDRQARVVSLGADGWLVHLRDASMQKEGWPRSKLVCAFGEGRKPSTRPGDDADYWPRLESDLLLYPRLQRDVLDTPVLAASVTWAWLLSEPLPDGYGVFRTDFEPIECMSMQEAFERIPGGAIEWSLEMRKAAIDFAAHLRVDRALLMAPYSILTQCTGSERRQHFIAKGGYALVTNLRDDLGRDYAVRLPSEEIIIWDSPRSAELPANPQEAAVITLRPKD